MSKIRYQSLNSYCKKKFGRKIYKIAIDGGFTCPNRDGSISYGGCGFCSQSGSGDFAESRCKSISQQIDDGRILIESKMGRRGRKLDEGNSCQEREIQICNEKSLTMFDKADNSRKREPSYIAYFQAYTNTYAPVEELRAKYVEAINHPEVVAISIATRPDCLPDDVVSLLFELNEIKPVWVELGLQTIHEDTARAFNRGYELEVYDRAIDKLVGLNVITHVILGLPGETRDMMLDTVKYVVASGSSGIKLQLLHILEDTPFFDMYKLGQIECLELEEYIDIVCDCLSVIPEDMVVHRLTGDGDKKLLVAPMWSANKRMVLNKLNKRIEAI